MHGLVQWAPSLGKITFARLAKDEDGVYRTYGQWGSMVYPVCLVSRTLIAQSYSVTLGVATVTKRLAVTIAEPYTSLRVSTVLEAPARG